MVLMELKMSTEVDANILDGRKMEDKAKIWEHAWSTDEVRKNSSNWTLAGDIGLLKYLQEFSHQLISRTHEMEKIVDNAIHQSKDTCAKVSNVINDFQMLSNIKFVENRVYDEEISDSSHDTKEETPQLTKEQKENEVVARAKLALQLGLNILDTAFEQVEIEDSSDSEDESLGRTELKPRNPYENRPLPYVIGSDEFQRDDFAGLKYVIEDEPPEDISQTPNDSSSESSLESETETDGDLEDQEEKGFVPQETIRTKSESTRTKSESTRTKSESARTKSDSIKNVEIETKRTFSDSEGSDLFGEDEEEIDPLTIPTNEHPNESKSPTDFLKELENKLKIPTEKPKKAERSPTIKEEHKVIEKEDDLFGSEDDFLNDKSDDLFSDFKQLKKESTGNIFSITNQKAAQASIAQEIEKKQEKRNSLVKEIEKKQEKRTSKNEKQLEKRDSLFDDDEDDDFLFGSSMDTQTKKPVSAPKNDFPDSKKLSKSTPTKTKPISAKTKPDDSLFDSDSDNELFFDKKAAKPEGNFEFVNENVEDDLFTNLGIKDRKISKENDLFDALKNEKVQKPKTKSISDIKPKEKSNSLFDDSDDFDLFGPSKETAKPLIIANEPSLFDDSLDNDLFAPIPSLEDILAKNVKSPTKEKPVSSKFKISENKTSSQSPSKEVKKEKLLAKDSMESSSNVLKSSSEDNDVFDFDKPVDSISTLSALNKDRARIQVKRRKPTKKGRQAIQTQDEVEDDGMKSETTVVPEPETNDLFSKSIQKSAPKTTHKMIEEGKQNLMSQLVLEAAASKILKKTSTGDDLFSNSSSKPNSDFSFLSPSSTKPSGLQEEKNIFGLSDDDDDLFKDKINTFQSGDAKSTFSFDEDDDDDIFKNTESKDIINNKDNIFDDDSGDDIFGSTNDEKYEVFPKSKFEDEEDDDDIFSDLSKPTKVTENKPKPEPEKKTEPIFEDPLGEFSLSK